MKNEKWNKSLQLIGRRTDRIESSSDDGKTAPGCRRPALKNATVLAYRKPSEGEARARAHFFHLLELNLPSSLSLKFKPSPWSLAPTPELFDLLRRRLSSCTLLWHPSSELIRIDTLILASVRTRRRSIDQSKAESWRPWTISNHCPLPSAALFVVIWIGPSLKIYNKFHTWTASASFQFGSSL